MPDTLEERFTEIETDLAGVATRVDELEKTLKALSDAVAEIKKQLENLRPKARVI
jgi:uncharacterized coiled-coil protein SlyX